MSILLTLLILGYIHTMTPADRRGLVWSGLIIGTVAALLVPHEDHEHEVEIEEVVLDTIFVPPPDPAELLSREVDGNMEIAEAIIHESEASGLDPNLIVGIIRVENPWLDPGIENWYGAIGLMQVVGWIHQGRYPECGEDLTDIRTNICYGTRVYQEKLEAAGGNHELALRLYNGCWGDTYVAGCESYPIKVVERGKVEIDLGL